MTDQPPESIEAQIESIRRTAGGLNDHRLDEALAMAVAQRDVAAAHKMPETAAAYQELALALDGVRRMRTEARREIEHLTGPPMPHRRVAVIVEDEPQEPPC